MAIGYLARNLRSIGHRISDLDDYGHLRRNRMPLDRADEQELDELQRQLAGEEQDLAELQAILPTLAAKSATQDAINRLKQSIRATKDRIKQLENKRKGN